jgi:hypothetical protein
LVTRYQYKILKKALRNCGFTPINQREVDACKYLFNKKMLYALKIARVRI